MEPVALSKKLRRFRFTWNNYSQEIVAHLKENLPKVVDYLVIGFEKAPTTGTKHLQGYVEFAYPISGTAAKGKLDPFLKTKSAVILFECKASREDNIAYCKKIETGDPDYPEKFFELIRKEKKMGERNDIYRETFDIIQEASDFAEVAEAFPEMALKHHAGIDRIMSATKAKKGFDAFKKMYSEYMLTPWQQRLANMVSKPASKNNRTINWYYEYKGGRGKSIMANWLVAMRGAIKFDCGSGKDIIHAYNGEPIVIFDFSRTIEERVNYDIMEKLLSGNVFSPKYSSSHKYFPAPWIIVFANWMPKISAVSSDRWRLVSLNKVKQLTQNAGISLDTDFDYEPLPQGLAPNQFIIESDDEIVDKIVDESVVRNVSLGRQRTLLVPAGDQNFSTSSKNIARPKGLARHSGWLVEPPSQTGTRSFHNDDNIVEINDDNIDENPIISWEPFFAEVSSEIENGSKTDRKRVENELENETMTEPENVISIDTGDDTIPINENICWDFLNDVIDIVIEDDIRACNIDFNTIKSDDARKKIKESAMKHWGKYDLEQESKCYWANMESPYDDCEDTDEYKEYIHRATCEECNSDLEPKI